MVALGLNPLGSGWGPVMYYHPLAYSVSYDRRALRDYPSPCTRSCCTATGGLVHPSIVSGSSARRNTLQEGRGELDDGSTGQEASFDAGE